METASNLLIMDLPVIKKELKERLALGLNYGIQAIEELISPDSIHANEVVNYKSQFNDLSRLASQNVLDYAQIEMGFNKIRMGLLVLIDRLGAEDLQDRKGLPEVQNRDLQYRKSNFFQLLDIHLNNLQQITVELTYSSGSEREDEIKRGRDAFAYIYEQYFKFRVRDQRLEVSGKAVIPYARTFFEKFTKLEVYMKTVRFILDYILEDKVEQHFFMGVFKSILSTPELTLIFYFAISDLYPGFKESINKLSFIGEELQNALMEKDHLVILTGDFQ